MTEPSTLQKPVANSKAERAPRSTSRRPPNLRWPLGRWLVLICGLLIFQLGFAYLVADRPIGRAGRKEQHIVARTVPGTLSEERLSQTFFTSDPLLFPLASQHGFSGLGWMTVNRTAYQFPEEIEPPNWLTLRNENLGRVVPAQPKPELPFQVGQQSTPQTEALPVFVSAVVPRTNSLVRVEGDLRDRAVGLPIKMPARPSDKVLKNSVVDIAVNGAGEVVARRLVSPGSGSDTADADALKHAKLLRFRPLNAIGTIWGQAIFEWETAELPEEQKK
ncbi:MAG: hypothetical protein JWO95_1883 [Verrucomicrobiales bacterium]|nr:hypothetical protein [Verrucomicrobiales bacterium]